MKGEIMRNVVLGIAALLLAIGGFSVIGRPAPAAHAAGSGTVSGQVWMCADQEDWSEDCDAMDVHHKFTVIVQKWGNGHFMPSTEKFSTMPDGSFSHELAPGSYRFQTMVDGWKGLIKENEDLWGMWTAPDPGKVMPRVAPAGTLTVEEGGEYTVNPFHEVDVMLPLPL